MYLTLLNSKLQNGYGGKFLSYVYFTTILKNYKSEKKQYFTKKCECETHF